MMLLRDEVKTPIFPPSRGVSGKALSPARGGGRLGLGESRSPARALHSLGTSRRRLASLVAIHY